MKREIIMPRTGVDMEEGLITEWKKKTGEYINAGDVLFAIESEKATQDIKSDYEGYLREIIVKENETVPVGAIVAIITTEVDEAY